MVIFLSFRSRLKMIQSASSAFALFNHRRIQLFTIACLWNSFLPSQWTALRVNKDRTTFQQIIDWERVE